MKFFNKCRLSDSPNDIKSDIKNIFLMILMGSLLGVISKTIDNIPINNEILWQMLLGQVDLRNILSRISIWALIALCIAVYSKSPVRAGINVFCFFIAMLVGYYIITIYVSGFFPKRYMIAWGIITILTPIPAFFAWYAKGEGLIARVISIIAVSLFVSQAFAYGIGYFRIIYYPDCIFLIISIIVLFKNIKQTIITVVGAFVLSPIVNIFLPYIFGGL